MARYNTQVSAKSHERVKISGFKGIDTASASVDVDINRATEMRNMISRNGLNHKRYGWEQQMLNIDKIYPNTFGGAVRGIYGFKFAGEVETRTIVYANKQLWQRIGKGAFTNITPDNANLKDRDCQFYLIGDTLYIVGCGEIIVYRGGTKATLMKDEAYIPTTFINIVSEEYAASTTDAIQREALEELNLLTPFYKVELLGNTEACKTFNVGTPLYAPTAEVFDKETNEHLASLTASEVYKSILHGSSSINSLFVKIGQANARKAIKLSTFTENASIKLMSIVENNQTTNVWLDTRNGKRRIYLETRGVETTFAEGLIVSGTTHYIYLKEGYMPNSDGYLDLKISGEAYVYAKTVEFHTYNNLTTLVNVANKEQEWGIVEADTGTIQFSENVADYLIVVTGRKGTDYSDRITDCQVSAMFGVNGHSDRLFVAGNPNTYGDWASNHVVQWSEIDNFTYFPDTNYTKLGTQATGINGMQRLNDDSLCLFKEASTTEPTIYVMYGEYQTTDDITKDVFRTYAGNVAEGLIAPKSTGNLAGDILMLSENGVYGIEMSENVVSTSKYTKERSLPIKKLLKAHTREQLKNACSIVKDDRYLLAVGSNCYVAESRYSYKPKGIPRDTFSYEWYVWDNIPALCFAEIDAELYFGTEDGRLCKFDDKFTDRTIDDFGATTVVNNGTITVDGELKKDDVIVLDDEVYGKVAEGKLLLGSKVGLDENNFYLDNSNEQRFVEGETIYLYNNKNGYLEKATINSLAIGGTLINGIEYNTMTVVLENMSNMPTGDVDILIDLTSKDLIVDNPDVDSEEAYNQATVKINGILVQNFVHSNETWKGRKLLIRNVVAEWYSAIMDFGTPDYSKTLLGFTVAPERIEGDKVTFGYITRELDNQHELAQIKGLSLDNFTFFDVSFNNINTSFTKKVKVRNFNYLLYFFKSDSRTDTAINNITLEYKINHKNKGEN